MIIGFSIVIINFITELHFRYNELKADSVNLKRRLRWLEAKEDKARPIEGIKRRKKEREEEVREEMRFKIKTELRKELNYRRKLTFCYVIIIMLSYYDVML